ncbi:MAG: MBL fold metallo-hydrolase [Microgenomates group bacterium]
MTIHMDITYKDKEFRIKGKTGVLYSRPDGVMIESPDGNSKKELKGAGEYEVSGISVIGIRVETATVFVYEVDGLRICNLGTLDKKLSDSKISQVGDIDILLLPKATDSIEMLQQIESYYVIPFGFESDEDLDKFLKESSLVVEKMNKFSLKKEDLIEDSTAQIVVLNS